MRLNSAYHSNNTHADTHEETTIYDTQQKAVKFISKYGQKEDTAPRNECNVEMSTWLEEHLHKEPLFLQVKVVERSSHLQQF